LYKARACTDPGCRQRDGGCCFQLDIKPQSPSEEKTWALKPVSCSSELDGADTQ
jgi:hypothetical protein